MSQKKIKKQEKKQKDLDPNQDEFIHKTVGVLDWVYAHRRPVGLFIFLALAGSVAAILINYLLDSKNAEASALLASGLEASTAVVTPPKLEGEDSPTPKEEKDGELLSFDSSKARATEMLKRWEKVGGTGNASIQVLGNLGIGIAHFELGEYDKAIQAFEKFLGEKKSSLSWLRPAAIEGLAYALEGAGKLDDARAKLETLMAETQGEAKRTATYQAARIAQLKGDAEGAKKLFRQVLDAYADEEKPGRFDIVFMQARTRLLALDPKAKVPDMPAGGMGAFDGMDPRILQQLIEAQQRQGAEAS